MIFLVVGLCVFVVTKWFQQKKVGFVGQEVGFVAGRLARCWLEEWMCRPKGRGCQPVSLVDAHNWKVRVFVEKVVCLTRFWLPCQETGFAEKEVHFPWPISCLCSPKKWVRNSARNK